MVKIKIDLEKIFVVIFLAVLFFIGPGILFDHRIKHEFPYSYLASDAFQHQIRAEAVKDAGNFKNEAFYISKGFDNIVGRYPPLIYHLAVVFSYASWLETYDSIYFLIYFFAIIGVLIFYFLIRNFNKNVALISLPLAIIAFTLPASIGFAYGHWPSLLGQFFLIAFAWCVMNLELEKSYIMTAIIFSSIILSHTSEGVFALIFLAIFFIIKFINKNIKKKRNKKYFNWYCHIFHSIALLYHYFY